jgi:hypothetical protein
LILTVISPPNLLLPVVTTASLLVAGGTGHDRIQGRRRRCLAAGHPHDVLGRSAMALTAGIGARFGKVV